MDQDIIIVGLFITLGIGMLAAVVGAWLPGGKRLPDWFMAIGGSLSLLGFGLVTLLLFDGAPPMMRDEFVIPALLATVALGVLLFAMGYVTDRWQRRLERRTAGTLPEQRRE